MHVLQNFERTVLLSEFTRPSNFPSISKFVFQPRYVLNHLFDFWLAEKYFEPSWKKGLAKTGLARQVPPSLQQHVAAIKYVKLIRIR